MRQNGTYTPGICFKLAWDIKELIGEMSSQVPKERERVTSYLTKPWKLIKIDLSDSARANRVRRNSWEDPYSHIVVDVTNVRKYVKMPSNEGVDVVESNRGSNSSMETDDKPLVNESADVITCYNLKESDMACEDLPTCAMSVSEENLNGENLPQTQLDGSGADCDVSDQMEQEDFESSQEDDDNTQTPGDKIIKYLKAEGCYVVDLLTNDNRRHRKRREVPIEEYVPLNEPSPAVAYAIDIFDYLVSIENERLPSKDYLARQPQMNAMVRSLMVNWVLKAAQAFDFLAEMAHLAVGYMERYLSLKEIIADRLRLLGTCCLRLAAKYDEVRQMGVDACLYAVENEHTPQEMLEMEFDIVKTLRFDLGGPTPNVFISILCATYALSLKVKHMSVFVCELALLNGGELIGVCPSLLASSAVFVASFVCNEKEELWGEDLESCTGYEMNDLRETADMLRNLLVSIPTLPKNDIVAKYSTDQYLNVAVEDFESCASRSKFLEVFDSQSDRMV